MNSTKPKGIWNPVWPGPREALLRLLLITLVIFPLSWAINALLIGNWNLIADRNAESVRHLVEWTVIWIAAVCVIFLASLLPAFHWLFSRRNARRFFVTAIWIVTLAVLFYAEENWRGARAWKKYLAGLEAQGAQLDLAAFTPKPVPDEQNFAATPFVQRWFAERTNAHQWTDDNYSRVVPKVADASSEKSNRFFFDLVACKAAFDAVRSAKTNSSQKFKLDKFETQPNTEGLPQEFKSDKFDPQSRAEAAPAVLEMLKDDEAFFAELRSVSGRPYSRYPIFYDMENPWGILLPHLASVKHMCERLRIKACAELAAGKTDDALADVQLMLRLADSVKDEPFLISYLVQMACVRQATQPVWEGLAEHRWSDAQLQDLQKQFSRFDFLAEMKVGLEGERAAGVLTGDLIRKKGLGLLIDLVDMGRASSADKKLANWIGGLIPRGWFDFERLNYFRLYRVQLEGAFDVTTKRIWPERIESNLKELEREFSSGMFGLKINGFLRHRFLSTLLLPALSKIPEKTAMGQTAADHAALACALERFRLANGIFPDSLDALVPKFMSQLPTDALTGQPYNYRKTADGQFILYSVGWNGKSDGGVPGKTIFDIKTGDWVWQYPAE